jgi:hypothetical protein
VIKTAAGIGFVLLALPLCAYAQAQNTPGAGSVYAGGGVTFLVHSKPAGADCKNSTSLCGDAAKSVLGGMVTLGVRAKARMSFVIEATAARSASGSATYSGPLHIVTDITSATYTHAANRTVGAAARFHPGVGAGGSSTIEPLLGVMIAHGTDRLTHQSRVQQVPGSPPVPSTRPDAETSHTALGFFSGFDITSHPKNGVSFGLGVRAQWICWRSDPTGYFLAVSPQVVPPSVGRWSFQFNAGVRWLARRR